MKLINIIYLILIIAYLINLIIDILCIFGGHFILNSAIIYHGKEEDTMSKKMLSLLALFSIGLVLSGNDFYAEENVTQSKKDISVEQRTTDDFSTRTLTIAADGDLTGLIVPYIEGIPNSGKVDLHYVGKGLGFSDFDKTTLFIKLPEEFKYIASQPSLLHLISGYVTVPNHRYAINSKDLQVFTDRIVLTLGNSFYLGVGKYSADIEIDYGKIIDKNPNIPIPDSEGGYFFSSNLAFNVAPWDIINFPIVGDFSGDWFSDEEQAIIK